MTNLLNNTNDKEFAGYTQTLFVYETDATNLVASYEWHTSSKPGFVITGRRKGDTKRMMDWLDIAGVEYIIVPNEFLKVRQIVVA